MSDPITETGTSLIERGGIVGMTVAGLVVIGRALGLVYQDNKAKDAKILDLAERSMKSQETATAALVELRKINESILAAVKSCPRHIAADHEAALRETQRMDPVR